MNKYANLYLWMLKSATEATVNKPAVSWKEYLNPKDGFISNFEWGRKLQKLLREGQANRAKRYSQDSSVNAPSTNLASK